MYIVHLNLLCTLYIYSTPYTNYVQAQTMYHHEPASTCTMYIKSIRAQGVLAAIWAVLAPTTSSYGPIHTHNSEYQQITFTHGNPVKTSIVIFIYPQIMSNSLFVEVKQSRKSSKHDQAIKTQKYPWQLWCWSLVTIQLYIVYVY